MKIDLKELSKQQESLKKRLLIKSFNTDVRFILGIDSSYIKDTRTIISIALLYDIKNKEIVEFASEKGSADFPYIPGYLSYRELPTTLLSIAKIKSKFDVIMVDGQGIAHPKGLGFASHLGVKLDFPTIGCAKKRLIGEYGEVGNQKGDYALLYVDGKAVGAVVRTKQNTKPVFVSPGNLVDISSSVSIVMNAVTKYRLPDPLRLAHIYSKSEIVI